MILSLLPSSYYFFLLVKFPTKHQSHKEAVNTWVYNKRTRTSPGCMKESGSHKGKKRYSLTPSGNATSEISNPEQQNCPEDSVQLNYSHSTTGSQWTLNKPSKSGNGVMHLWDPLITTKVAKANWQALLSDRGPTNHHESPLGWHHFLTILSGCLSMTQSTVGMQPYDKLTLRSMGNTPTSARLTF